VNWAAKALSHVALKEMPRSDVTYHLVSPGHSITVGQLANCVREKGYVIENVPYEAWSQLVRNTPSTAFAPLISRFPFKGGMPSHRMSTTNLKHVTQDCPNLAACDLSDRAIIECLTWLIHRQIIPAPSTQKARL